MRTAYIYKITNPKGRIYVGSTVKLDQRISSYKGLHCKLQVKIYRSIKKYGWENHLFEILKECKELDRYYYESYYGNFYNVLSKENLNLALPKSDMLGFCLSEETRKKIGKAHKGKIISEEQKKQMRENLRLSLIKDGHPMKGKSPWNKGKSFLSGEKNPMFGIKRSEDWKRQHSERAKLNNASGENHSASKIVLDFNTGIYYLTVKEASESLGINYSTLRCKLNKSRKNKTSLKYV